MRKIHSEQYTQVKHLIKKAPVFVSSLLDQYISGNVYSFAKQQAFIFETCGGLLFVCGKPSNELLTYLSNCVNQRKAAGKSLTLFASDDEWYEPLKHYLGEEFNQLDRYSFEFNRKLYENNKQQKIHPYVLRKVDALLIQQSQEYNHAYYERFWDSSMNFLNKGMGYLLLDGQSIISECISIYCSNDYAEIDIATDAHYRGQGLARIVSQAFIDNCLEKQVSPRWDCMVSNVASRAMAEQLGFELKYSYKIFFMTKA